MKIHQAIGKALSESGKSQADVARRMKVEPSQINHWVQGRRVPTAPSMRALANAIGCSLDELYGRSVRPEAEQIMWKLASHWNGKDESVVYGLTTAAFVLAGVSKPEPYTEGFGEDTIGKEFRFAALQTASHCGLVRIGLASKIMTTDEGCRTLLIRSARAWAECREAANGQ